MAKRYDAAVQPFSARRSGGVSDHIGVPPTCGCKDYGVHRAITKLDYERNAGRISARELGGKYLEEYEERVAAAEKALQQARFDAAQPGRVNPTPGQLLKELRDTQDAIDRGEYGLSARIRKAFSALFGPAPA